VSTPAKTEQPLVGRRGFGSLHPWPSAQYCAYCPPALFLMQGIRRAAPVQVTACRVVTVVIYFQLEVFTVETEISVKKFK